MSTITVPVSSNDHVPNLPELEKRELSWMGRIIHWIQSSHSKGIVEYTLIHTAAVLVLLTLIVTAVAMPIFSIGILPLLLYIARESARQDERSRYDHQFENLLKIGTEHSKDRFLSGRLAPLDGLQISLKSGTRRQILHDLDINETDAKYKKDIDLLRIAAAKYPNYIARYNLRLTG